MDWKECVDKKVVVKVEEDNNKIKSLSSTAKEKFKASKLLEEKYPSTAITVLYDCLRMNLEILALKSKYKVLNHKCYETFLKEVLKERQLAEEFEFFRKLRNSVNYYGNKIISHSTKIKNLKELINKIDVAKQHLT